MIADVRESALRWAGSAAVDPSADGRRSRVIDRIAVVQFATPDAMCGRVGAVNSSHQSSNQLSEFESRALLGATPAALLGGIDALQ